MTDLIVFSDLDGTLMEHESYSTVAASKALAELARRGITPILNSSKTQQEMLAVRQELGFDGPYICENGAALYNFSDSKSQTAKKVFGPPRARWLPEVHQFRMRQHLRFEGFSDWTAADIALHTGLDENRAELARQRQYSEPILWQDTAARLEHFADFLRAMDLQLIEGGRFISVQGVFDKSTAMNWLCKQSGTSDTMTVALGDSPNDHAMLNSADIAVVIRSAKSEQIQLDQPQHIIRTRRPGPAGWQEAMLLILERVDAGKLTPTG